MLRFDWKSTVAKCHQLVHPAAINPREMLGKDFVLLNENIKRMLGSNHPVLNTISNYYFNKQGKNIRPLIVLLMSQATLFSRISNFVDIDSPTVGTSPIQFEKSTPSSTNVLPTQRRLAEITEMIHTASLLHDDVIDASLQRRNFPTVNAEFGNKMAILAGDFLLARASVALSRLRNTQVTELIATVISNLVEGEFMQLRNSGSSKLLNVNDAFWKNESGLDISRFSYYMEKTYLKTASLIAKSSHAAALLGGSDNVIGNAAYTYGKCLGISFQLIDDMLDFVVSEKQLGKPINVDLSLGLATAPVLYAAKEFPQLYELMDRSFKHPGDVQEALRIVNSSQGITKTKLLAQEYSKAAIDAISIFPQSAARDALEELSISVVTRKR